MHTMAQRTYTNSGTHMAHHPPSVRAGEIFRGTHTNSGTNVFSQQPRRRQISLFGRDAPARRTGGVSIFNTGRTPTESEKRIRYDKETSDRYMTRAYDDGLERREHVDAVSWSETDGVFSGFVDRLQGMVVPTSSVFTTTILTGYYRIACLDNTMGTEPGLYLQATITTNDKTRVADILIDTHNHSTYHALLTDMRHIGKYDMSMKALIGQLRRSKLML